MAEAEAGNAVGTKAPAPPYIPFRTLLSFVEKREPRSLPPQIDAGYLDSMAGGMQLPFTSALKWLGLLDESSHVQPTLISLVDEPARRREIIGQVVSSRYGWLSDLNERNATMGALREAFEHRGVAGSTARKAMAFYLHAATFAGLPLSKNFKVRGVRTGAVTRAPSGRRPRARRQGETGQAKMQQQVTNKTTSNLASRPLIAAVIAQLPKENTWNQAHHDKWLELFTKALEWDVKVDSK